MSYGVRNTLILLIVFALIAGAGFSYVHFIQKPAIEELEIALDGKIANHAQLSAIAETFPVVEAAVARAENFIDSYSKTLFPTNDPDQIYKYLTELNTDWPRVEFNYIFNDSTTQSQYGIVRSTVNGVGSYRAVYNFINRIENSRPVQKVHNLQLSPVNLVGEYGNTNFNFEIRSYYDRSGYFDSSQEELAIVLRNPQRFHNPFYPLIRDVEPNDENLTNVEASRLIGMSSSRVFLRNQDGQLVNLSVDDRVYLGNLREIDVQQGRARFVLNKGGIIEEVTLEVQR